MDKDLWCVGTPDDLIAKLKRLDQQSGGFGGLLFLAHEWGTREQTLHSYELLARYVMPQFQGSLANLIASHQWSTSKVSEVRAKQDQAIGRARQDYVESKKSSAG